ncbi:MAG: hypothetical protein Ct9H90mP14_0890 [Methanobacteriota archaeon]|nr:MAG: hypothetical protein Ct9H90mP14_0890 [Euryarchaeota archaeon]
MESPELTANQVVADEFEAAEKTHGFAGSVRGQDAILSSESAPISPQMENRLRQLTPSI